MSLFRVSLFVAVLAFLSGCGVQLSGSVANQRNQIRSMEVEALNKLYAQNPSARKQIQKSAGYAVFDASGGKVLFGGMDHGNGVAVDNKNGRRTYMKMFELQPGIGLGYANTRLIFVFESPSAFNDFVNSGWEFGGKASAAAKNDSGAGGGGDLGYNVAPGVNLYQMTEKGAMVGLSITGAKYWRNDDLN
jgi:lipid-binding SYLF domain-containing protein